MKIRSRGSSPSVRVLLASGSLRRAQMLKQLNIPFDVCLSRVAERWKTGASAEKVATQLARQKARVCARPDRLVIAMDTLVVYRKHILGKPNNQAEAMAMLRMLSNRTHRVITGVALLWQTKLVDAVEVTHVKFRKLKDHEMQRYVNLSEPYDKAGAYGIQGFGRLFVQEIRGCYFNVVGFPIDCFQRSLRRLGLTIYDLMA